GLGMGSTFVVRLPLTANAPLPKARPKRENGSADSEPRRVLIVEDNADIRQSPRELLERRGHEVRIAADGGEGIARASENRPDVAIVDIGLPDIDGYGVAQAIRKAHKRSIYLIAL